jgi:hypothetical protein
LLRGLRIEEETKNFERWHFERRWTVRLSEDSLSIVVLSTQTKIEKWRISSKNNEFFLLSTRRKRNAKEEEVLDNQRNIKSFSKTRGELKNKMRWSSFEHAAKEKDLIFLKKKNRGFFSEEKKKSKFFDAISCSEQCLK